MQGGPAHVIVDEVDANGSSTTHLLGAYPRFIREWSRLRIVWVPLFWVLVKVGGEVWGEDDTMDKVMGLGGYFGLGIYGDCRMGKVISMVRLRIV